MLQVLLNIVLNLEGIIKIISSSSSWRPALGPPVHSIPDGG